MSQPQALITNGLYFKIAKVDSAIFPFFLFFFSSKTSLLKLPFALIRSEASVVYHSIPGLQAPLDPNKLCFGELVSLLLM